MLHTELPDPRVWPAACADGEIAALHAAALAAIAADTRADAARSDAAATARIERMIAAGDGRLLADAFAAAPSFPVARHLWRLLAQVERGEPQRTTTLRTTLAAMPVVLVSALDARDGESTLPAVLADPRTLEALLRDAGEFGGARTFSLAPALAGIDSIDVAALPAHLARLRFGEAGEPLPPPLDLPPSPLHLHGGNERVHLRFIVAAVLTAPGSDPLGQTAISGWGIAFAQALARQMQVAGVSLLALPRPLQGLVTATQAGRAAQREIAAQVFASNAIRKLRASIGEPTAIISAHRAADAPLGGELRLSLSSPFAPRDAEGFRCPLYPYEAVADVAAMLGRLLRDCRVADVRVLGGVHADVDPVTGGPLLFKDAAAASSTRLQ